MGSPMELPWWNCCICILVFCIWLYWIGFAWYRTGKIQTWLFIYQADMSIYTHTPLLNMLSCTPCIRKIHAGTPTKKKCIRRCCEPFKQGVPVSRRGSWGSKSERSRNRSHKRASQSPGGQSESDESNLCPIAFCSAFCRSGGLGTRTEQGKCEVVRHVRHVRDGVSTCVLHCVAGVVACCGGPPESVILDVRLRNQKNCFLKRRTSGRALRQKSMKKWRHVFFLAAVFICSLATRATSIKFWSANAQECCLEGTWWEEATTWRCR